MNKKISKAVLGLVIVSMAITSIYIGVINKDSYKVIDIEGNRDALEDASVIYQDRKGFYKTAQVNISKDDIEIDKYTKEVSRAFPVTSYAIEHRDLFKDAYGEEMVYKDDKSIGHVVINRNYYNYTYGNEKSDLVAYVEDKNIKNNKIQSYKIPIKYNVDVTNDNDINYNYVPIKYDGDIYIVLNLNITKSDSYKEDTNTYVSKKRLINVYKLNLNDKTSEIILNEKIGNEDDLSSFSSIAFSNDNIAYFIKERYKKDEGNKVEKNFDLVKYNVKEKSLSTEKIDINSTNNNLLNIYDIEGNKVTFISSDNSKRDKVDIYMTTMNLSNNEITTNNEKYTIKTEDAEFDYSIKQVRLINGKVYLMVEANDEKTDVRRSLNKEYIYVLDEKTKETLYVGIIKDESALWVSPKIVKEEEM